MKIGVCLIVKDEASYLLEWIAHYRCLGFHDIIVYDNGSADETPDFLSKLCRHGIVEHVPWPDKSMQHRQVSAYSDATKRFGPRLDWLAFFDSDEFLILHQNETIADLLSGYEAFGGLAVNWRLFGSSGKQHREPGLVMERFQLGPPLNDPGHRCVKVIVRPSLIDRCDVHVAHLTKGHDIVLSDRTPLVEALDLGYHSHARHDAVQLNHYIIKSREEWNIKRRRGRAAVVPEQSDQQWSDTRFSSHDINTALDASASRIMPRLQSEVTWLRNLLASVPQV